MNIASVKSQSDPDVEQIFIVDEVRRGRLWANKELNRCHERIRGEYVYILDDDCVLINDQFVSRLKGFQGRSDVVMVRALRPQVKPTRLPRVWSGTPRARLRGKLGNCLCYVVARDWYSRCIYSFGKSCSGAKRFPDCLLVSGASISWLDIPPVAKTLQLGRDVRYETTGSDWWPSVVKEYGVIDYGHGDWRIRHWLSPSPIPVPAQAPRQRKRRRRK